MPFVFGGSKPPPYVLAFARLIGVRIFYAVRFRRHQGTALRVGVRSVDEGEVLLKHLNGLCE